MRQRNSQPAAGEATTAQIEELMATRDREQMKTMQETIDRLEEITRKQEEAIYYLQQGTTTSETRSKDTYQRTPAGMATPDH